MGGHVHDTNLHCPSDEHWQCGGQLISTSPVGVPCSPHKSQHTTRGDLTLTRREGSTSAFRNRIACPDDAGHRDVTSCKTREV